jgi:hypothetical protein
VIFFKRTLPLIICFLMGVLLIIQYFVPHHYSEAFLTEVNDWEIIIFGFAMFLGIYSLFHFHLNKVKRQVPGWGYSIVVFLALFLTLAVGIYCQGKEWGTDAKMTGFGWIYNYMMVPLQGTMFSILAFFIASAAFRAFRAKTLDAALLLIAAVIIMFCRVPLGEYLWNKIPSITVGGVRLPFPSGDIAQWIMGVPNTAGQRGILLGVALGIVATSLKIIFGIERAYLGGGKE